MCWWNLIKREFYEMAGCCWLDGWLSVVELLLLLFLVSLFSLRRWVLPADAAGRALVYGVSGSIDNVKWNDYGAHKDVD